MLSDTMSEPVTQGQFFEAIKQLREDHTAAHARLRETIETGFEKFGERFDLHEKEDRAVEKRVTRIETEREIEATHAVKRASWIGFIAATVMTALWRVADLLLK